MTGQPRGSKFAKWWDKWGPTTIASSVTVTTAVVIGFFLTTVINNMWSDIRAQSALINSQNERINHVYDQIIAAAKQASDAANSQANTTGQLTATAVQLSETVKHQSFVTDKLSDALTKQTVAFERQVERQEATNAMLITAVEKQSEATDRQSETNSKLNSAANRQNTTNEMVSFSLTELGKQMKNFEAQLISLTMMRQNAPIPAASQFPQQAMPSSPN